VILSFFKSGIILIFSYQICEVEVPQHEEEFVEIQRYITETRHPGFISYETHAELLKTCKTIEKRRTEVDKQMKESHNR
jgi:hypothetical protein